MVAVPTQDFAVSSGLSLAYAAVSVTEIEKDAARYRWLVKHEYISSELWRDFAGRDANAGLGLDPGDPSAIIDYQMRAETARDGGTDED